MSRHEGGSGFEWDLRREALNKLSTVDQLWAKLIETGAELDPFHRAQLRRYIKELLGMYGIPENVGVEGLLEVRRRLNAEIEYLPTPPVYPSLPEFQRNLLTVYNQGRSRDLPHVPDAPLATDMAQHAQYDWGQVQGRDGRYTLDYLYELGKVMVSPAAYQEVFPPSDAIALGDNWQVVHGPQRALVLRTLGANFVSRARMNDWVKVGRKA